MEGAEERLGMEKSMVLFKVFVNVLPAKKFRLTRALNVSWVKIKKSKRLCFVSFLEHLPVSYRIHHWHS